MVFTSIEPSGNVLFILLFVFSEIHSLILCLENSGFSCRKETRLMNADQRDGSYCFVGYVLWSIKDLKVERQQLGPIDYLTDVLIGLTELECFLSKQTVCWDQFHRFVCFAIEAAVQLGEEKVNLIWRLFFYCVKLEHLWLRAYGWKVNFTFWETSLKR